MGLLETKEVDDHFSYRESLLKRVTQAYRPLRVAANTDRRHNHNAWLPTRLEQPDPNALMCMALRDPRRRQIKYAGHLEERLPGLLG